MLKKWVKNRNTAYRHKNFSRNVKPAVRLLKKSLLNALSNSKQKNVR